MMNAGRKSLAFALAALFVLASGPLIAACPAVMARQAHDADHPASGCGRAAECCCRATSDSAPIVGGAEPAQLCPVQAHTQLRPPATGVQSDCHAGIQSVAVAVPVGPAPPPQHWLDRDESPPIDPALHLAAATGLRSPPIA